MGWFLNNYYSSEYSWISIIKNVQLLKMSLNIVLYDLQGLKKKGFMLLIKRQKSVTLINLFRLQPLFTNDLFSCESVGSLTVINNFAL